jgi:hypothetical protein
MKPLTFSTEATLAGSLSLLRQGGSARAVDVALMSLFRDAEWYDEGGPVSGQSCRESLGGVFWPIGPFIVRVSEA